MSGPTTANQVDNITPAETIKSGWDKYNAHWHSALRTDDTERNTTATSYASLSTFSGLTIATTSTIRVLGNWRKPTGVAASADIALSLNGTTLETTVGVTSIASATSQAEVGTFEFVVPPRTGANYVNGGMHRRSSNSGSAAANGIAAHSVGNIPTATITDLIVRGKVSNASLTLFIQNVRVFVEG